MTSDRVGYFFCGWVGLFGAALVGIMCASEVMGVWFPADESDFERGAWAVAFGGLGLGYLSLSAWAFYRALQEDKS